MGKKNDKNEYIIGQEEAKAAKKEQERLDFEDIEASPLETLNFLSFNSMNPYENPKEVELDRKIVQLVKTYKSNNEAEREKTRQSLTQHDIYKIFLFCERATVFGLRRQNKNIELSLAVLSMVDGERCDFRDALVSIAFVNHGIEKLKLDSDELYKEAILLANPAMKELLSSFQKREPKEKAIERMAGYTEYQFEGGIGFIRCGYGEYVPTRNLPAILFDIMREIEKDKYHFGEVSISEEMPLVWVGGEKNERIKNLLKQSKGTVKLRAQLREEYTKDWMSQMFLFYIVEFENESKSKKFKELLGNEKTEKFARIFGSVGNIFYVLIAKATTLGINDFETYESLQRLREPIERKIIEENNH